MSGSHKEFPKKAVIIQLGLAALVGLGYLITDKPAPVHAMAEKVTKPVVAAAEKVLAPVGKVEVKEQATASAAKSGEEIYAETCVTCHKTGIANAPKLDDKGEWESRLSGGFTALVASAIKGKGGMPPKGGNPDYSDSEIELVVNHMVKEAGIDLVPRSASASSTTATAPKAELVEKTEEVKQEAVETVAAVKQEATETVDEVQAVVEDKVEAVAEKVEEVKTEVTTAATTAIAAATESDNSKGLAIYKGTCFACHDTGVAGSPKLGDKAAWEPRIATGKDALYEAALKGLGAMPAKGGNTSIADDDIKAAVDYMTSQAK